MTDATPAARPLLVVGATELELAAVVAGLREPTATATRWGPAHVGRLADSRVVVQALGLGKANTAAGLALAVAALRPTAILQVGIGGAYVGSFLSVGLAMLADAEVQLDLGLRTDAGWADWGALGFPLLPGGAAPTAAGGVTASTAGGPATIATDPDLTAAVAAATGLPRGRFATLDAVTHDVHLGAALQAAHDVAIESMEGAAAAQVARALGVPFAELRAVSNVVGERDKTHWDLRGAVRVAGAAAVQALGAVARDPRWGVPG